MIRYLRYFLAWIGLTRRQRNGKWFVPFRAPPRWQMAGGPRLLAKAWGRRPYLFRNIWVNPRFHNDRGHRRLLPFRWGGGWLGFEFGDRGGEHVSEEDHG